MGLSKGNLGCKTPNTFTHTTFTHLCKLSVRLPLAHISCGLTHCRVCSPGRWLLGTWSVYPSVMLQHSGTGMWTTHTDTHIDMNVTCKYTCSGLRERQLRSYRLQRALVSSLPILSPKNYIHTQLICKNMIPCGLHFLINITKKHLYRTYLELFTADAYTLQT